MLNSLCSLRTAARAKMSRLSTRDSRAHSDSNWFLSIADVWNSESEIQTLYYTIPLILEARHRKFQWNPESPDTNADTAKAKYLTKNIKVPVGAFCLLKRWCIVYSPALFQWKTSIRLESTTSECYPRSRRIVMRNFLRDERLPGVCKVYGGILWKTDEFFGRPDIPCLWASQEEPPSESLNDRAQFG